MTPSRPSVSASPPGPGLWLARVPRGRTFLDALDSGWAAIDVGFRGDPSDVLSEEEAHVLISEENPGMSSGSIDSRVRSLMSLKDAPSGDLVLVRPGSGGGKMFAARLEDGLSEAGGLPARRVSVMAGIPAPGARLRAAAAAHASFCRIALPGAIDDVMDAVRAAGGGTGLISPDASLVRDPRAGVDGHGMALIVESVLRGSGLVTRLSAPGPDGGVDVLAAGGPFGLDDPMVVQVKSGRSPAGSPELDALLGVMSSLQVPRGILFSWAGFSAAAIRREALIWGRVRLLDAAWLLRAAPPHAGTLPAHLSVIVSSWKAL
ncbi:MAG: hypothetical protein DI629_19960 [Mesorhizobium amorphae]|nr:MAG: hypothetical protein DI629_19960 [Mesorhizobium amorphae]